MSNHKFDRRLFYLMSSGEPFYLNILAKLRRTPTETIPTAGVRVSPDTGYFEMLYNPAFMDSLTDLEFLDVVKHEILHLVFLHVTHRLPEGKMTKKWNYATDLAINSFLTNLPEGALRPGEGSFADLPLGQTSEYYMGCLPDMGEGEGDGDGEGKRGCHEGWSNSGSRVERELAAERFKQDLKKASQVASVKNKWGSVPYSVRKDIAKSFEAKIDWRKVLRYFVKTSQRSAKKNTVRRINKRYPYIHPGSKAERVAQLAICIDQSGSVSDQMLSMFFAELNKLSKLATFFVVPFDTRVDPSLVYEWKKGEVRKWERVMSGGTCFNAPTRYVNESDFDACLILTDLCAPKPIPCKVQRAWVTTSDHAQRPYFTTKEKTIVIDK